MRVLISAYTALPGAGSESGAGWMWSRAAAERHDVWLMTRSADLPMLREGLADERDLKMELVPVDPPSWTRSARLDIRLHYLLWQIAAAKTARRLHREVGFDVAHHLTFAVDWMPTAVASLRDVPFVWGPVGGATGMGKGLWRWLSMKDRMAEAGREIITRLCRRAFGDSVARRAALIIAQNDDVAARFQGHGQVVVEPNPALELTLHRSGSTTVEHGRHAIFAGRLLPWKGVRLSIATLAQPHVKDWTLTVYGDGPESRPAQQLARALGVRDRVRFEGVRPRHEVIEALNRADAFLFPSMHDSAPWALAEAMAAGCPPVSLDRGGPGTMIRETGCGVAVPVGADLPRRLSYALASVERCPTPVARWDAARLPDVMDRWYEAAVAGRS